MSYFDRQGIPEEVLKVRPCGEQIRESMEQIDDDARGDEEDKEEDVKDGGASVASGNDVFEEAVHRLRSYSFVSMGEDGRTFEMHRLAHHTPKLLRLN